MKKDEQNKLTGNLAADELYPESLPDEYHVEIYIRLDPDENEYGFDAERHEHDYFKTLEEARAWAEKLTDKNDRRYYEISLNDKIIETTKYKITQGE